MSCKCCCTHGHTAIQKKRNSLLKDYWRIILSALLLFGVLILNATDATFFKGEYVPFIWYLLAYLPVGLPVMREAWESILQKDVFSEFTLMSIATLGAFYIGEYPEGVAVMLFYSLGELFQDKAVDKAKRNISALLDVRPETATVIRNGSTLVEAPQRVQVGETIEVKAYLSDKPLDVDELLHTLGLYEHRNKLPNQLSGGQQQRTAIGRAIVKNPDILLCDEPTGALDYKTSKEILKLIETVNEKYGNTIIMVTHNDAIKDMATRVVRLKDGMIRSNVINEKRLHAEDLEW